MADDEDTTGVERDLGEALRAWREARLPGADAPAEQADPPEDPKRPNEPADAVTVRGEDPASAR